MTGMYKVITIFMVVSSLVEAQKLRAVNGKDVASATVSAQGDTTKIDFFQNKAVAARDGERRQYRGMRALKKNAPKCCKPTKNGANAVLKSYNIRAYPRCKFRRMAGKF
jgi:hypothetical protein